MRIETPLPALSGAELAAMISNIGMSKSDFARFVDLDGRSIRRYLSGAQPIPVIVTRVVIALQQLGEEDFIEIELAPWQTLGLPSPDATLEEAVAARKSLLKKIHPDHAKDDADRARRTQCAQRINDAFDVFKAAFSKRL